MHCWQAIQVLGADAQASSPRPRAASPQTQHLARLVLLRMKEHAPEWRPSTTSTARTPTLDELNELLHSGAPFPSPYDHLEQIRAQALLLRQRAYGGQPTMPSLTVGLAHAPAVRLAFERVVALAE